MTDDEMNIEQREQVSLEALHLLERARLGCAEGQYSPALQQANETLWRFRDRRCYGNREPCLWSSLAANAAVCTGREDV